MIYRRMNIGRVSGTVSYTPVNGEVANFSPFEMIIPDVLNEVEKEEFKAELSDELHNCCGKVACEAVVSLQHWPLEGNDYQIYKKRFGDLPWLDGATFTCEAIDCPLRGPSSGDREPRVPTPEPPALAAEVPLPIE